MKSTIPEPAPISETAPDEKDESKPGSWSARTQIRGSSLLLFGKMPTKGINFAVQVLTVGYLTKGDYGAFAYATSIVTVIQTLVMFGLDRAVTRYIPIYHERGEYGKIFGTLALVLGTVLLLSIVAIAVLAGGPLLFGRDLISDPLASSLLLVLVFLAPLQAIDEVMIGMLAVFGAAKHIFVRKHLLAPLLKLAVILTVMYGGFSVIGLAVGYLVTALVGIAVYVRVLIRILREQGVLQNAGIRTMTIPAREVFMFTIPLLTTDLLYVALGTMDAVMLEHYHDISAVAVLRAVLPMALLNQLVMASFGVLFTPMAARLFSRNDSEGINRYYWQSALWVAVLSLPIFLVTFTCAGPMTELLYGSRYQQSAIILSVLSVGYYFNAALGFNGMTLRVYGKIKYTVAINAVAALVNLLANYLLIPRYGVLGAACATCGTLVVYNVLKQAGLRLGTGINLFDWNYLRVYVVIVTAAIGVFVAHFLWEPPLVAGLLIVSAVSLLVVRITRKALNIEETFPELMRVPIIKHLLGP